MKHILVPAPIPGKTFKDVSERHVKHHDPLAQTFYTEVGNSVGKFSEFSKHAKLTVVIEW